MKELRKEFEEERWEVKAGDQWTIDKYTKQKSFGPFQKLFFCNAETGEIVYRYEDLPELRMDDADEQMVEQYKAGRNFDDTGHVLINNIRTNHDSCGDDVVFLYAFKCDYPHVVTVSNNALSADSKLVIGCKVDKLLLKSGVIVSLTTSDCKVLLLRRNDRYKLWSGLSHFFAWDKKDQSNMSDIMSKTAMSAMKTVFDTNALNELSPKIGDNFDISLRHTISCGSRGGPQYSPEEAGERLYSTVECVIPVAVRCSSERLKSILNNIIGEESGVYKFTDYALININEVVDYAKVFGLPIDDTGEVPSLSFLCRPVLEAVRRDVEELLRFTIHYGPETLLDDVCCHQKWGRPELCLRVL